MTHQDDVGATSTDNILACTTATFSGTFTEKIAAIAGAGFTHTEVWMSDLFEHPEGPDVAAGILRDAGVQPLALQALRNFEGCPREQWPSKRRLAAAYLDICAALQIPTLVLASNASPQALASEQCLQDDLGVLGDLAAARGVRVAYEPIAWASHVSTLATAVPLLARLAHAHVGLQVDSFHVSQEADGVQRLSEIGKNVPIFLVEVSDHIAMRTDVVTLSRAYRLFPGEGASDVMAQASALARLGYAGPLVVEIFNAYYKNSDRREVAARAYRGLAAFHAAMRLPA